MTFLIFFTSSFNSDYWLNRMVYSRSIRCSAIETSAAIEHYCSAISAAAEAAEAAAD
jgi:hypothetical protein